MRSLLFSVTPITKSAELGSADFGLGVFHGLLGFRHHFGGEVGVGHAMYLLPVLADLLHDLVLGHAGSDEVAVRANIATGD